MINSTLFISFNKVHASKVTNNRLGLPQDPSTSAMSWSKVKKSIIWIVYWMTYCNNIFPIWGYCFHNWLQIFKDTEGCWKVFTAVRFNFRPLASLRCYLSVTWMLLWLASRFHLLSDVSMTAVHMLVVVPFYLGYFPRYYPNSRGIVLLAVLIRVVVLACRLLRSFCEGSP